MHKTFWALLLLCVVALTLAVFFWPTSVPYVSTLPSTHVWSSGAKDAPVELVEYSDFQCPACALYSAVLKPILSELSGKVRFTYRHFPLKSIHKNAEKAARAAEAAGEQGKFFEMHDMLFAKQAEWANDINPNLLFYGYAEELGLSMEDFTRAYKSEAIAKRVDRDEQSGIALGINATPTFFLNGEKLERNPGSAEAFRELLSK